MSSAGAQVVCSLLNSAAALGALLWVWGCASATQHSSAPGAVGADQVAAADSTAEGEHTDLSQKRGARMQAFSLPAVDGKPYDVKPHLGRDVIMISFWATWCSPCKAELSRMAPIFDELKEQGFLYLAVSTDNPTDAPKVRPYVSSAGYSFPVLLDTQSTLIQRYNPRGDLPFYVLVNRRGEVVEQHQGFSPGDEVAISQKIRSLLKAK